MGQHQNPQWPVRNPLPPAIPDPNFTVGLCYAPFDDTEWEHLQWVPVYRIHLDQAAMMVTRGASFLLIVDLCDSAQLEAAIPFLLSGPWAIGVELGNEPSFKGTFPPSIVNAWYQMAYRRLRDVGYPGHIVTAGIANLNADTLNAAYQSIQGLPPSMVFGWHFYDTAGPKIPALREMLGGRAHFMTEYGIRAATGTEAQVAEQATQDILTIKGSGAGLAFWYQLHDDIPGHPDFDFGIHTLGPPHGDGHWRLVEQSLVNALRG